MRPKKKEKKEQLGRHPGPTAVRLSGGSTGAGGRTGSEPPEARRPPARGRGEVRDFELPAGTAVGAAHHACWRGWKVGELATHSHYRKKCIFSIDK